MPLTGPRYTVSDDDPLVVLDTKDTGGSKQHARTICKASDVILAGFIAATCTAYDDLVKHSIHQAEEITTLEGQQRVLVDALALAKYRLELADEKRFDPDAMKKISKALASVGFKP